MLPGSNFWNFYPGTLPYCDKSLQLIWSSGTHPNSKVDGANMGPIWGWQDPGGPHVGPMKFAIWALISYRVTIFSELK